MTMKFWFNVYRGTSFIMSYLVRMLFCIKKRGLDVHSVSPNTRPHQLHWSDREMGTAISCTECSQAHVRTRLTYTLLVAMVTGGYTFWFIYHRKLFQFTNNILRYRVNYLACLFTTIKRLENIMHVWQSRVEIEGYSVAYFDCIAVFEAPYR